MAGHRDRPANEVPSSRSLTCRLIAGFGTGCHAPVGSGINAAAAILHRHIGKRCRECRADEPASPVAPCLQVRMPAAAAARSRAGRAPDGRRGARDPAGGARRREDHGLGSGRVGKRPGWALSFSGAHPAKNGRRTRHDPYYPAEYQRRSSCVASMPLSPSRGATTGRVGHFGDA